ncbi:MAG: tRNA (adenosine(37)-N6)-dimethylallyltransferase MiaA [Actinomycetota bacterium]
MSVGPDGQASGLSHSALAPLVIVGPTASGKSALAVALAHRCPGAEIVSADAMAVYRGMDIGTAKPPVAERGGIPHHLIDVADPSEEYTVARFQTEVNEVVAGMVERGAMPIVVGGTGLYVRAVVDNFTVPGRYPEIRAVVEAEPDTARLWTHLDALDPTAAAKILPSNRRRLVRALEVTLGAQRPFSSFGPGVDAYPPSSFRQVGLRIDRAELDRRIDERYDRQLEAGLVAEVARLARGELSRTAAQALGYKELLAHVSGECTESEAMAIARTRTKRFARRQERWFRRDPRISWFDSVRSDPVDLVDEVEAWWREPDGATREVAGQRWHR